MSMPHSARLPDDAIAMLLQYQQAPSDELAEELILHYEPMVKLAASKISRNRPDLYDDLFQVGQLALFRLLSQFDPSLGIPFEPYVMKSLIGNMKNYLRDKSWYIQVPRRIKEKGLSVQQAIDELTVRLERSPNIEEIAAEIGLTSEETLEVLAGRDMYHYVSLDTPISDEDNATVLGEMIGSLSDEFAGLERRIDLQSALARLKPEESEVLKLVFEQGLSQRAIADSFGISQMSVSRIQNRAIDKLRELLEEQPPDS